MSGDGLGGAGERSILGRYDLHVHTTMSDGGVSLGEVVAIAAERGVTVGIADHVSGRNPNLFVSSRERLEAYLAAIERAPVFRSAELCWCDPFSMNVVREYRERFHYFVGSNHGFPLPDGTFLSPWTRRLPEPWSSRPQDVMEILVHNLCDMVASMPIAIAAHSTLIPPALIALDPDIHTWWTEPREARFIEATVENGVAIEISNRYRLPHDRFLLQARDAGATFSLGSDGHQAAQVAQLDWAVDTAIRTGIGEDRLFIPDED